MKITCNLHTETQTYFRFYAEKNNFIWNNPRLKTPENETTLIEHN